MKDVPQGLPITVSLGSQGGDPFVWVDCVVASMRGQLATLTPRITPSARLRARLRDGEAAYAVFEVGRSAFAWKGVVRARRDGRTLEFLIHEHPETIVSGSTARAEDGEMLLRLMYISQAAPGLAQEDVDSILTAANRRNPSSLITGALCLREGFFAQILEGPEPAVRTIYRAIEGDARHTDPVILSEELVDHRLYGGWAMKGIAGEGALTAADELAARLALADRDDAAALSSRWLALLQAADAPSWRDEWLAGRQSVLMLRELVELSGPPAAGVTPRPAPEDPLPLPAESSGGDGADGEQGGGVLGGATASAAP